jgi:hypothetical protein
VAPNDAAELVFQVLAYKLPHTLKIARPTLLFIAWSFGVQEREEGQ